LGHVENEEEKREENLPACENPLVGGASASAAALLLLLRNSSFRFSQFRMHTKLYGFHLIKYTAYVHLMCTYSLVCICIYASPTHLQHALCWRRRRCFCRDLSEIFYTHCRIYIFLFYISFNIFCLSLLCC